MTEPQPIDQGEPLFSFKGRLTREEALQMATASLAQRYVPSYLRLCIVLLAVVLIILKLPPGAQRAAVIALAGGFFGMTISYLGAALVTLRKSAREADRIAALQDGDTSVRFYARGVEIISRIGEKWVLPAHRIQLQRRRAGIFGRIERSGRYIFLLPNRVLSDRELNMIPRLYVNKS